MAAVTWSRISASSGETTSVGPAPAARRADVAAQYTADLPQPVACTTSTRAAGWMMACTASTWSARGTASAPASRSSTNDRCSVASCVVDWVASVLMPATVRRGCHEVARRPFTKLYSPTSGERR